MDSGPMTLIRSTEHFASWRSSILDQTISFVPTMGALHSGHVALVEYAKSQSDIVVVSVFVNALQFGDSVDFDKYPRTLETDYETSIAAGASIVFAPSALDMFPTDYKKYLTPSVIANKFEGASRPGHFAGVVTVVNRLFEIVTPQKAIFGAKDYQQIAVIRAMARELHPTIEILQVDTIRDLDGLALSSRNARLSQSARLKAKTIPDALFALRSEFDSGQTNCAVLKQTAFDVLKNETNISIEYLEVVDRETLEEQSVVELHSSVVLFAGIIDGIRLIDNVEL